MLKRSFRVYGARLRARRKALLIDLKTMAKALNTTADDICKWEDGSTLPSSSQQYKIAQYLRSTTIYPSSNQ